MKGDKILSLLGLAARAGRLVSGEFMTENSIRDRKAKLVIAAADASDRTRKNFSDMCAYYRVPFRIFGSKTELGTCTGKEYRAVLAVTDEGFRDALEKLFREREGPQSL